MTDDEIRNMPAGREMDALVFVQVFKACLHEHRGWKSVRVSDKMTVVEMICDECGEEVSEGFAVPRYSTDIAAAWEVVRRMTLEKGFVFEMNVNEACGNLVGNAHFRGERVQYTGGPGDDIEACICRAALLAVNGN